MLEKFWLSCKNNTTLRYGVPMMLLVIGGSFGLREFTQIRYDVQKLKNTVDPSVAGVIKNKEKEVSLESEYEKLKEKSFAEWKNIRGPRPWEDSKSYQDEQRTSDTKET
ncbi:cytochrome c oxidase assembly protein COX16 homolog, mitochondrial isoform X1 [Bufo gargarizans]|uniref:cytochrome c oxidase assembly protein COX16 homolog, mitochondrial isoform X1 n=1 Tax=Bufo gargarizans TaxID=30331 RepID=UPI001CF1836C|nr:cytochrome c oxidase assembly protein COX16 homolog, mitochondrial isoform X1 [Bufo gargarizans]